MGALSGSREMKEPPSVMAINSTPTMMQPNVKAVISFMAGRGDGRAWLEKNQRTSKQLTASRAVRASAVAWRRSVAAACWNLKFLTKNRYNARETGTCSY